MDNGCKNSREQCYYRSNQGVDDGNNNIRYFMKNYQYGNKYLRARKKEMNVSQPGFSPFFLGCFHMGYDSAA